jgi:solute carrier family 5 (sodium-coupled monocarboxylate transporter), member 8/12
MPKSFQTLIVEYLVFFILVVVTTVIPLWSKLFGKQSKQRATKEGYIFATGAVSIFSMMLSIARGTLGVRSFLGN